MSAYHQVVKNACATQALLSVLLNVDHTHIELGPTLADFKEFASPLDPTVCNFRQALSGPRPSSSLFSLSVPPSRSSFLPPLSLTEQGAVSH